MKKLSKILLPLLLICLSAFATDLPEKPFIHVTGLASENVKPDIAKIYFHVEFTKSTYEEAFAALNARVTEILHLMQDFGIATADIQSYDVSTDAQRSYQSFEIAGYRCSRQISVTIRNLEVYGKLVNEIHGAEGTEGFRVNFDSTEREGIEKKLLKDAVADSKEKASILAGEYGTTIGEVYSVSDIAFPELPEFFVPLSPGYKRSKDMIFSFNDNSGDGSYLIPSTIRIDANIHVIFYLKPKATE